MRSLQPLDGHDLREAVCPWCGRTPRAAAFGLKAVRDGVVVGLIALAPAAADGVDRADSVLVCQMWVHPDHVGELVGTQLVQRAVAHLGERRVRFLVAGGTHGVPDCTHLPGAFWQRLGFVEAVTGRRWRLDLRRTVCVPDLVRGVRDAVARAVNPGRPAPAGRGLRSR